MYLRFSFLIRESCTCYTLGKNAYIYMTLVCLHMDAAWRENSEENGSA